MLSTPDFTNQPLPVAVRDRVAVALGLRDSVPGDGAADDVADGVLVWVAVAVDDSVAVPDADVENDPEPVAV